MSKLPVPVFDTVAIAAVINQHDQPVDQQPVVSATVIVEPPSENCVDLQTRTVKCFACKTNHPASSCVYIAVWEGGAYCCRKMAKERGYRVLRGVL